MSITPLRFSGISTFSEDFQAIVDRAVAIANLPVQALQQDQLSLLEKQSAWLGVETSLGSLVSELGALGGFGGSGSLTASTTSSSVRATVLSGAQMGTWTVDSIESLAETATSTSTLGYADSTTAPVTGGGNYLQLVVGSETLDIALEPGEDNLTAIRDKINSLDAGVSASILYSGGETPGYYLTLSATETGAQTLDLRTEAGNPASSLMTVNNPGANAVMYLNGVRIESATNTIDDALEGVSLSLYEVTDTPATISVSSNPSGIVNALSEFAEAYNLMQSTLDQQIGEDAGALAGDGLIGQIRRSLANFSGYQGSGAIESLADLGLTFDTDGVLSLDGSVIESMTAGQIADVVEFLGDGSTGFSSLASQLETFTDPVEGLIQIQLDEYTTTDSRLSDRIAVMAEQIDQMQTTLLAQLQAADAALAVLESQRGMLDASLESLKLVLYGKQEE